MLLASIYVTIKSRFVQFRKIPTMVRLLFHKQTEGEQTVKSRHALFTAMSTTLGLSTIVAPVIAISLGGPGVVLGFLLASFLGAALNFMEVKLAISHREVKDDHIRGGPMGYLEKAFSPLLARWYAFFTALLMMVWSAAQANQLSAMLSSPLLGAFAIPKWVCGGVLALLVTLILIGGIKRIGNFSSKLVPAMFILYTGASLWIIGANASKLPEAFSMMFSSCLHPQAFGTGAVIGGLLSAFRWGMMKGLQGSEAGVGTQAIPHSMAETKSAEHQAILSMVSTYTAGLLLLLSSLVTLLTGSWLDPTLPMGISMVAASFQHYFSYFGLMIVTLCSLLFSFGTILGNSFNGSQCFLYVTRYRGLKFFYAATALLVLFGALADVATLWGGIDFVLSLVMVPHAIALVLLSRNQMLSSKRAAMF
ncbi:MAG: Amino-acid carrier protein AlsT [Chlamydiales bacterium]|nr:Amino-acid carrier protein AlsT [Chlamydiales bacterium]MCH9636241.1 Amino-acid carrier protein AlsT [Chlamydiales bacterium]